MFTFSGIYAGTDDQNMSVIVFNDDGYTELTLPQVLPISGVVSGDRLVVTVETTEEYEARVAAEEAAILAQMPDAVLEEPVIVPDVEDPDPIVP